MGTHTTRPPNRAHKGLHAETRCVSDGGAITTLGAFCIVAPFWRDYGYNIEIGNDFYANHNAVILDGAKVKFGNHVFIASNCGFYTAGHPIDFERRNQGLEYSKAEIYVPEDKE